MQFNNIELRPEYQLPAHLATVDHCKTTTDAAINSMTVGAGKTISIGAMAFHTTNLGGKVLVLARQGELIEQNSDDAWQMGCKNSIFSASLNQKSTTYPCVMGTEKTVANHLNHEFSRFIPNLILIDECHHVDFQEIERWQQDKSTEIKTSYGKIITHFLKLNPKLRIIGYTGSPFRGKIDIVNKFWTKKLSEVPTMQLVEMGYLVPPVFGFGDDLHHYDLHEFDKIDKHEDFSSKELVAMQRKISKDKIMTHRIMEEVVNRCKDRLGVLITCAGKKHCEQVAECLPPGSWGIVTDDTSTKKRRKILSDAKEGKIKYVIQVGCLTTGINVTFWSVCVILRRIGSLTLLVQLIGRVLRTLKPYQIDQGLEKNDALILDYTDTFESMGEIFDDPILNKAVAAKADESGDYLECPKCQTHNSKYAVRCIGGGLDRCDHFFQFQECQKCGTKNAPTAQACRNCQAILIDPNKALLNKAYTDADYKPVLKTLFEPTKSGDGLKVVYQLDSIYHDKGIEKQEFATEYLKPFGQQPHEKQKWRSFVSAHVSNGFRVQLSRMRNIQEILRSKAIFDMPCEITHRVNPKGFSIINRKKFRSGREDFANS